ncbi:hypothetical protein GCM10012285_34990 [Streptomyces kronopolitis]|uniref:Uncharacterized protein n=1 Tax=Streptomyces kronopolitis TaxID=1612435 RepID=A0ABQ2JKL3_9ACTN|nr:hypothetical protein GCM10012285_34990 [Streptomyces kronopolitis]
MEPLEVGVAQSGVLAYEIVHGGHVLEPTGVGCSPGVCMDTAWAWTSENGLVQNAENTSVLPAQENGTRPQALSALTAPRPPIDRFPDGTAPLPHTGVPSARKRGPADVSSGLRCRTG